MTRWLVLKGELRDGVLVSAGGLERCGGSLLLRSVVTHPDWRGQGLAGELVRQLHQAAGQSGHTETWLMTETAESYFQAHHSYRPINRDVVPTDIRASSQFSELCPASATVMVRRLDPVAQNH